MNFYNCFILFSMYWISDAVKPDVNIAFNKPARQSSTYKDGGAGRAVDGKKHSNYRQWSCSSTSDIWNKPEGGECWWEVNLKGNYRIGHINILNRDDCCAQRLHDFWIEMFEDGLRKLCYVFKDKFIFRWLELSCIRSVQGGVLRITKPKERDDDALILCEVEVFETFETDTQLDWKMKGVADSRLYSDDLQVFSRTSRVGCAIRCIMSPPCFAYNFSKDYTCEIVSNPRARRNATTGYTYYALKRM